MLQKIVGPQSLHEALPNMVGVVTSSVGFLSGLKWGRLLAVLISEASRTQSPVVAAVASLGLSVILSFGGYGFGHFVTRFFLHLFPRIGMRKFLLVFPNKLPNCLFFILCLLVLK